MKLPNRPTRSAIFGHAVIALKKWITTRRAIAMKLLSWRVWDSRGKFFEKVGINYLKNNYRKIWQVQANVLSLRYQKQSKYNN